MGTTQDYAQWSNFSGPLMELQKINQEASEKIIRECISFCSDNTGTAIKCMQTMPRATSPEDYFSLQMKMLSQQGEKTLEFTQNIFDIYQDALRNHFNWTEEKVNETLKKSSKSKKEHESA